MKNLLAGLLVASMIAMAGCAGEVVTTRPAEVVYDRPPSPGPDYVWISGDWVWLNGSYSWHEGHWGRGTGKAWREGRWENHRGGYRWRKGHWE
ncbi:MAG TPA: YXWGXW repeat-containing protein [Puia sp.]|nr:YXWGXW repeat-containing protein [Puia sp.]